MYGFLKLCWNILLSTFTVISGPYQFKRFELREQIRLARGNTYIWHSSMASADLINELTAQVGKERPLKSAKNEPVLKSVKSAKSEAEEINVIDNKLSETSEQSKVNKKKQKAGFFHRVKRFVTKKSGTPNAVKQNGDDLKHQHRTKSTSDLADSRTSGQDGNQRLSAGSDEHLYSQSDTVKSDTDEKPIVSLWLYHTGIYKFLP